MKKTVLLAGALVSTLTLFSAIAADDAPAADTPSQDVSGGRREGRQGRGERGERGGMNRRDPRAEAEAQIKAKFPEEYAAIEKMRAEADAKLKELAKKAGVEIPKTYAEQMAELKEKYPKEMAEIEDLQKTDRMAAFRKMRELAEKAGIQFNFGRPGGMGGGPGMGPGMGPGREGGEPAVAPRMNPMQQLRELRRKFPKEMAAIEELRKTDPEAARVKIQELTARLEAEKAPEPQQ